MVNNTSFFRHGGFTLVEAMVAMVLSGVIFTGIMITSTITMERITSSMRTENEERQMDRFQLEVAYFLSRAYQYQIYQSKSQKDSGLSPATAGNYLECTPQDDPLEPTDIQKIAFYLSPSDPSSSGGNQSLAVEVTLPTGTKTYTYSYNIQLPAGGALFRRDDNGWITYSWELDSGYGIESFSNRAIPRASL